MNNTGIYLPSINSTYDNWTEVVSDLCLRYKNWRKEFSGVSAEYSVHIDFLLCKCCNERLELRYNGKTALLIVPREHINNQFRDNSIVFCGSKYTDFYPGYGYGINVLNLEYNNLSEEEHFQTSVIEKIHDYETCLSVLDKFVELDCHNMIYAFYPEFFSDLVQKNIKNFLKGYGDV